MSGVGFVSMFGKSGFMAASVYRELVKKQTGKDCLATDHKILLSSSTQQYTQLCHINTLIRS